MLNPKIIVALDELVDSTIRNLPKRKEDFYDEFEAATKSGLTDVDMFTLRRDIFDSIMRDIRYQLPKIFAKHSGSKCLDEVEYAEMWKLVKGRQTEIGAAINALQLTTHSEKGEK